MRETRMLGLTRRGLETSLRFGSCRTLSGNGAQRLGRTYEAWRQSSTLQLARIGCNSGVLSQEPVFYWPTGGDKWRI